ncbi:MAG: hypothetical protein AMJ88_00655 [Anaerolineae bacterium SM23_ 63]|nr:MAG: hypothetical protein AMJ88_00655 [Anaerolineae bacterium SM23_ 63]HEY45760.1 hypothetical protein [Anaerolineae bacterium]
MRQYIDLKMIKRWNTLSKAMIFLGLGLLIGAFIMTFREPQLSNQFLIMSIIGVVCSQTGLAINNRWGAKPRTDEIIDEALKGLDNRYEIYHYKLGTSHALLSPEGAFAIVPRYEDGEITYAGEKWFSQRTKRKLLRRSGKRSLGDLQKNAEAEARSMQKALHRALPDISDISIQPILVFVNPDTFVKVDGAPLHVVHAKKFKSLIRRLPKAKSLTTEEMEVLAKKKGF